MKPLSFLPNIVLILLLTASLIALIFFVIYPNDIRFQSFITTKCTNQDSDATREQLFTPKPEFRLLIGILTLPDLSDRRHLIRHTYALQTKPSFAEIDVRFVFCNITNYEQQVLLAMEIMLYNDIIILNCSENMNKGKTYSYFSSLPQMLEKDDDSVADYHRPYDYIMKTDDDTFVHLHNIANTLRYKPRNDLYLGFLTPCHKPQAEFKFMSGMGYVLSWDIVQWIATSEISKKHSNGPEDILTGIWMKEGNKGKNIYDMNPKMYDFMEQFETCFRHAFEPDTVAVHKLKNNFKWAKTLEYFNITKGLKPSKLYHFD